MSGDGWGWGGEGARLRGSVRSGEFASSGGIETQARTGRERLDGEDVPDVEASDVGDEGVDVVGGVHLLAFAANAVDRLDVVAAGANHLGAFELDPPEALAVIEDEVVALAVAPRGSDGLRNPGG
jgi:hypothetical protein